MSTRSALFALAAAVVLASAGLSSTTAFAGSRPGNALTGNSVHVGSYHPGCGQIGCNLKQ